MDLVKRRQVLLNLISRVGRGQQNIYRWVDELIQIDNQLDSQQGEKITSTLSGGIAKMGQCGKNVKTVPVGWTNAPRNLNPWVQTRMWS